jgi:hypothetical protein
LLVGSQSFTEGYFTPPTAVSAVALPLLFVEIAQG